jgi:hypothetical protein
MARARISCSVKSAKRFTVTPLFLMILSRKTGGGR